MVLTGGTENMSQTPYAVRNARWGSPLGVDLKVNRITVISENKPTPFFLCKLLEKVIFSQKYMYTYLFMLQYMLLCKQKH